MNLKRAIKGIWKGLERGKEREKLCNYIINTESIRNNNNIKEYTKRAEQSFNYFNMELF